MAPSSTQLSMEAPSAEVLFIVLIAFVITTNETVAISLLIRIRAAKHRAETGSAGSVKVRAFGL